MRRGVFGSVAAAALCALCLGLSSVALGRANAEAVTGGRIAYSSGGISVMRADGTHVRRLTSRPFDRAPDWSPNGHAIAFARGSNGGQPDVYVIGSNGRGLRRLARRAYAPAWSPNGRTLAISRGDGIDLVNADGSGRRRLLNEGFAATWSPNGKELAYTATTIDPEEGSISGGFLAIVNADGSGKRVVFATGSKGMPYEPAWSPDGRQIAFKRDFFTGGPGEIWVVSPVGQGLHRLTRNGEAPGWSPDSRRLVYAGFDASADYRIYIMRRDGTRRVTLGSCAKHRFCGLGADPDWHR